MRELLITLVVLLILFVSPSIHAQSDSYYYLFMDIGENISEINNQLNLEYKFKVFNKYNVETNLDLNKRYYFLRGDPREEDWNLSNYSVIFEKDRNRLELGETYAPTTSSFVYGEEILGSYLDYNNYQIWFGDKTGSGFFGSGTGKRFGISYDLKAGQISYHYNQNLNESHQYLTYNKSYSLSGLDFSMDSALAVEESQSLIGEALRFNLFSYWQGINYRSRVAYYSPKFQKVKSKFDVGDGSYNIDFAASKRIGPVFMQGYVDYYEDNLNNENEQVNKNLSNGYNFDYYTNSGNKYSLDLSYQVETDYQTNQEIKLEQEKDWSCNFVYDRRRWEYELSLSQSQDKDFSTNKIDKGPTSAEIGMSYDYGNYNLNADYNIEREDDQLERDFNFNVGYNKIMNQLDYYITIDFQVDDEQKIYIKQELDYEVTTNQDLTLILNLGRYISRSANVNKNLAINYRYQF